MDINRIWTVMKAEFLHIIRDPISLIISLVMPLFMLFLCTYCLSFELKDLRIAIFDMDKSVESKRYIQALDNSSCFKVNYNLLEYDDAFNIMLRGKTRCVVIIPTGFSRDISSNKPAKIQTFIDGTDTNAALNIGNYLSSINASYSYEIANEVLNKQGLYLNLQPVKLVPRVWYNQSLREFTYSVTGTFSLAILGFIPILSALAIVREKESGSIQQIFASPIQSYEYIAGKMSPYVIMLSLDFIFVIIFGLWWFKLPFRGNFLPICIATFFNVFASVAIGFFISTLTKSQLTAMLLGIIFTLMPSFLFVDALISIDTFPVGWEAVSFLFPGKYYTTIIRAEILKGTGFMDYWKDALSLLIYCFVLFSICAVIVKKKKI